MKVAASLMYYGLWHGGGGRTYVNEIGRRLNDWEIDQDIICGRPLFRDLKIKCDFADVFKAPVFWNCPYFWKVKHDFSKILLVMFTHNACEASYIPGCHRLLMKRNYELIHTHDLPDLVAATLVKRKRATPIVAMIHHAHPQFPLFPWAPYLPIRFTRKLLNSADVVVSTGDGVERIKRDFQIEVQRIDPGVDISLFRPNNRERSRIRAFYGINEDDKVILSVGRLIPLKNISLQIQVMKDIIKMIKNVKLLIVGEGISRKGLQREVHKAGLDDQIIFTGGVSFRSIPRFYSASDLFLLTSHYDCFPTVALEAMSCELPVVSTNVGGVHYIVENGITGFLCDATKKETMETHILQLLESEHLRVKMGKAGRRKVKEQHTWELSAKKYIKIYDKLLTQ